MFKNNMKRLIIVKTKSGKFMTVKVECSIAHGLSKKTESELTAQLGEGVTDIVFIENTLTCSWDSEVKSKKVFDLFI
jgi:hypothetical protein